MRKSFVITSPNNHHSKSEKQPVVPVKSEKTHNHVQKGDKEQHRLAKQEKMPHGKTEKAPVHGAKQANSSKADKGQVNAKHDRLNNRAKSPVTVSPTDRHKEKLGPGLQKQVSLSPPDYYIDPQVLLGDFVEEEVAFAGRIPNFPLHEDITNRTTILRIIDQGKIHRTLASEITPDNKAVFIVNVYNIKIVRKKNQELLMRLSIHQIASVSYIKDDRQHILALKYGDPQSGCHLAVMFCENKTVAEEICALVNQCFQLVYTDATMQYIDGQFAKVLESGGTDTSNSGSSVYESTIFGARPTRRMPPKYAFLSPSTNGSAYSSIYRSLPSRGGAPSSSSDLSSWSAAELLQDYLNKLHKKLSAQELKTFAQLLTTRHTDLTFTEFCDKVLQLFGQKRKNLMSGLWPFIGERDHMNFERYLESKGIATDDDTGYWSMPSSASGLSRPRGEDGPVLVRYMDSLHIEDNSTTKRSLSSHSDPGPGAFPIHNIRFMDNVHFADDPFVTIP